MRACVIGFVLLFSAYGDLVAAQNEDVSKPVSDNKDCKCNHYNCGCCKLLEWDSISMKTTICANASYLEQDYGISITLTVDDFAVINETLSAKNPPPICVAEDIEEFVPIDVCLRIYDIDYTTGHACFMVVGKISVMKVPILRLGCVNFGYKQSPNKHWWQKLSISRINPNHNSVHQPVVTQI